MPSTEERLTALEINDKNIFHQLDEIKAEQKEQRRINTETATELAAVKASAKQAHLRIDRIEGREYPGHGGHE